MNHPTPPGTRDVLPDELKELRRLSDRMRAVFEGASYGEVWTPAMEYEEVLRRGDERAAGAGYRLFDGQGQVLVLRSDMTIPIARLVATRYRGAEVPLRFCYFAHAYRVVSHGRGQSREFLQGGLELIGEDAPLGDAEVVAVLVDALAQAGLRRHRIGVGDGSLYRTLLENLEVPLSERPALLECLSRRDMVELEASVERLGFTRAQKRLLTTLPTLRGGPEVLESAADGPIADAVENLRSFYELLRERGVADRVIFDLGLLRELGYYTGAVFEVYDPAVGFALGGGGRYDDLVGRFGRPLPACGVALDLQRVHAAQTAEEELS
jgi:ATP phosphoribosyltransferase regulatory subunit